MNDLSKELVEMQILLRKYKVPQRSIDKIINRERYMRERCEYLERSNNRREDEIISLRNENVDGETYKSRNEKAIEYINEHQRKDEFLNLNEWQTRDLLNILQGEDKDVNITN